MLELRQSDECTDAGLIALAAGCTKLEELLLDGCTDALTDKAVDTILQGLKQLHTLSACGSDRWLSYAARAKLVGAVKSCSLTATIRERRVAELFLGSRGMR